MVLLVVCCGILFPAACVLLFLDFGLVVFICVGLVSCGIWFVFCGWLLFSGCADLGVCLLLVSCFGLD